MVYYTTFGTFVQETLLPLWHLNPNKAELLLYDIQ
jgi:hypothetical protein